MIISLLAAMDEKRGIGWKGKLPWRLSSDLKRFRELTMGHHIIVGRKTFESIGKPLAGRKMIIVTRNPHFRVEDCLVAHTVEEAVELARERGESEVFICGGAEIYAQALPRAHRFYMTLVHAVVEADVFFPEWEGRGWIEKQSSHHEADEKNQYPSTFRLLETNEIRDCGFRIADLFKNFGFGGIQDPSQPENPKFLNKSAIRNPQSEISLVLPESEAESSLDLQVLRRGPGHYTRHSVVAKPARTSHHQRIARFQNQSCQPVLSRCPSNPEPRGVAE